MAKHRDKKEYFSFLGKGNYNVTNSPGGSSDSPVSLGNRVTLQSSLDYGDNLPNWMRLLRLGENATTSMSGTTQRAQVLRSGTMNFYQAFTNNPPIPGFWYTRTGSCTGNLSPSPFLSTGTVPSSSVKAENLALARWNAKAAEVNRQFQGGVFFAELTKTLHGLRHPAEALFGGIRKYHTAVTKLRRRMIPADFDTFKRARRRLVSKSFSNAATGLWLEHSFHWLPLMYDIQGAMSALEHTFQRLPSEFLKVSARDVQLETVTGSQFQNGIMSWSEKIVDTYGASVRMYGRVRVGTRLPYWPDSKALGYDIRSFVPTVWELIPYSWAVDYFTNIGDILYGFSQGGQDVMWSARGIKRFVTRRITASANGNLESPGAGYVITAQSASGQPSEVLAEKAIISRATFTGFYTPTLEWKCPGVSLKWLNLGAAFLQRSVGNLRV
jgi:hypothetical protein